MGNSSEDSDCELVKYVKVMKFAPKVQVKCMFMSVYFCW